MEPVIIILLLIALIISLILNLNYFKIIKSQSAKPAEPGDGHKPDLSIHKFQVTPGKDILNVTVIGYDNDESIKAKAEYRQPQVKVLTKFSLQTITSKNPAILVSIPTSLLIPEEYLGNPPPPQSPLMDGDAAALGDQNDVATPPSGWPPRVTTIKIETS